MKLLERFKKTPAPPNAHGQRNIDDSYFSIWLCPNGHGGVGSPDKAPNHGCTMCTIDGVNEPFAWRVATRDEAHAFIYELEGSKMYDGVGFRVLP